VLERRVEEAHEEREGVCLVLDVREGLRREEIEALRVPDGAVLRGERSKDAAQAVRALAREERVVQRVLVVVAAEAKARRRGGAARPPRAAPADGSARDRRRAEDVTLNRFEVRDEGGVERGRAATRGGRRGAAARRGAPARRRAAARERRAEVVLDGVEARQRERRVPTLREEEPLPPVRRRHPRCARMRCAPRPRGKGGVSCGKSRGLWDTESLLPAGGSDGAIKCL
jgi:hypothetical protein